MGVNTQIYLPGDVRLEDVTKVMGIAAGLKPSKAKFDKSESWAVRVPGIKYRTMETSPYMCDVILTGKMVDGDESHYCSFFFEVRHEKYDRELYPKSTAFWIMVGKRVVDFFGGKLVYSDCGDEDDPKNFYEVKRRFKNNPEDGKPWQDFQQRMFEVEPIKHTELITANAYAAYDTMSAISLQKELAERQAVIERETAKVKELQERIARG